MLMRPGNPKTIDVDRVIECLLEVRGSVPMNEVNLPDSDIRNLCKVSTEIFLSQPMVLEITAPLIVCGDIHGQYSDLLKIFDKGGYPPTSKYLFLGDYVDRGKYSIETFSLLLAYKIKYPTKFFMLRGNHECASVNRVYGFYDDCCRRYNIMIWKTFTDCFNCLPVVAIIENKIFCCHGGLSPDLHSIEDIRRIPRPIDVPEFGLLCDLLWSDPCKNTKGWGVNERGLSFVFGEKVLQQFLKKHGFDLIVRAHQMVEDGYEFFANKKLVTIFSAPNYCDSYDNAGAILSINAKLVCCFFVFQPKAIRRSVWSKVSRYK